ncbi:MAG: hypothetical protein KGH54_01450 [Candidatus Micrarchaeota archaeon]|nr:hypothetical protein [Candidatus Micrarchaeota archaeon]
MLHIFKTPSYSGKNVHRYVEKLIRNGKEILIVSPYIDCHYASYLLRHSGGKRFYIISSSLDRGARRLLEKGRFPTGLLASTILFAIADSLLYYLGLYLYAGLLSAIILLLAIATAFIAAKKPTNIMLKVPREFVHAKLYISESEAIRGSANLTYRGQHENVEHVEVDYDKQEINRLRGQFWEMWRGA